MRGDERTALREQELVASLAALYPMNPPLVAQLCDEHLDRSGRLLGLVRNAVKLGEQEQ